MMFMSNSRQDARDENKTKCRFTNFCVTSAKQMQRNSDTSISCNWLVPWD